MSASGMEHGCRHTGERPESTPERDDEGEQMSVVDLQEPQRKSDSFLLYFLVVYLYASIDPVC